MRPLLVDLFCGAGGAAVGYHRAGFDVIGVDLKPQPRYPFEFHQADALEWLTAADLADVAAIHASPPCQAYARVTAWRGDRSSHPDLIDATRLALMGTALPWVMENVPEASLRADLMLCGSQFGLRVRRHRVFETWPQVFELIPSCQHRGQLSFMHKGERAYADAMGCEWMTSREAREAIPPAYTEHIGGFLLHAIRDQQPVGGAGRRPRTTRR